MARMISIKLDGQILFNEDGSVHMGVGMDAIWGKCCAEVGVVVHRLVVSLQPIEADGCPEAGVVVCHSVVGFLVIEADDGCPRGWGLLMPLGCGLGFCLVSAGCVFVHIF